MLGTRNKTKHKPKGKAMTNEQILFELFHDASEADKQAYKVTGSDLKQWAESLSDEEVDADPDEEEAA